MEYTKNRVPLFNGDNYALWIRRMQVHLLAQAYEVWEIVEQGYKVTTNEQGKKNVVNDDKTKDIIISGLTQYVYVKVLGCKIAKGLRDKL